MYSTDGLPPLSATDQTAKCFHVMCTSIYIKTAQRVSLGLIAVLSPFLCSTQSRSVYSDLYPLLLKPCSTQVRGVYSISTPAKTQSIKKLGVICYIHLCTKPCTVQTLLLDSTAALISGRRVRIEGKLKPCARRGDT